MFKRIFSLTLLIFVILSFTAVLYCADNVEEDDVYYAVAGDYVTVNIGSDRQMFIDDTIVDYTRTTADLILHEPNRLEDALKTGQEWQGDYNWYQNIVYYNGKYMMFYGAANYNSEDSSHHKIRICVAESEDGLEWYYPNVGNYEISGTYDNNVVLEAEPGEFFDNFTVFIDTNPECPPEQKFKAIGQVHIPEFGLGGWYSENGYDWTYGGRIHSGLAYDSNNVCFWDQDKECYVFYLREMATGGWKSIEYLEKEDFWEYTKESTPIEYNDNRLLHMYTNNIHKYYRAPDIYIGMATRFSIQIKTWDGEYEAIPDPNNMSSLPCTNCILMTSRDGHTFTRWANNYMKNTPQTDRLWGRSWFYGESYPVYGILETETGVPGQDNVLSMFMKELRFDGSNAVYFVRYETRIDGFTSYSAGTDEKRVVTVPMTFTGNTFKLNFSTSALGYVKVRFLDENYEPIKGFETEELYGDKVDREISFKNGNVADLEGKVINIEFTLSEADIYSFIFE